MKTTVVAALCVIAVSLAIIAGVQLSSAQAQPEETAHPEEAANKDAVAGISHVKLAHDLAQWGRDNQHPGAVAIASRILQDVPVTESAELGKMVKGDVEPTEHKAANAGSLLAEAKQMVKDDTLATKVVEAMAEMGLKGRGALKGALVGTVAMGGPKKNQAGQLLYAVAQVVATFKKGELAAVWVGGTGKGEVDLYVYDSAGKLVASDETKGDSCWCDWTPKAQGDYTIKIINRSSTAVNISIVTN